MIFYFADWLAAADSAAGGDVSGFLQYGAVGIIAALGVLFFRVAYKDLQERLTRQEAKYDKLVDTVYEKVIPALQASASSTTENTQLLREVQSKTMPLLQELERKNRGMS